MTGSNSIVSGMAGRYASALFELALDAKAVDKVANELASFGTMLDGSADLRRLVSSPVFGADEQARAIVAVLAKAKIKGLTANFISLVAKNSRLFAVRDMISGFVALLAAHKGEITADVTSASKLTAANIKSLKAVLKKTTGKDVQIDAKVDESLLGGLIVKVGSRQIDTSLRTKLNNLQIAMKEIG